MEWLIDTLVIPVFKELGLRYEEIDETLLSFMTGEPIAAHGTVANYSDPERLLIQIEGILTLDPAADYRPLLHQLNSVLPGGFCVQRGGHLAMGLSMRVTAATTQSDFGDCFHALLARLTVWHPVLMRIRYEGMSIEEAWEMEPLRPDPSRCDPRVARLVREAINRGV